MIRICLCVFALCLLGACTPAPAFAGIHVDKLIDCIGMVEGNPWTRPGGLYGFTKATWNDYSGYPYSWSQKPDIARKIARRAIADSIQRMTNAGIQPTPYLIAVRWRWGHQGMMKRMNTQDDYGQRVTNLYLDAIR
jgi:hypothetical protein